MIVGLANDEIGYIIPKRQWDEKAPFAMDVTRRDTARRTASARRIGADLVRRVRENGGREVTAACGLAIDGNR